MRCLRVGQHHRSPYLVPTLGEGTAGLGQARPGGAHVVDDDDRAVPGNCPHRRVLVGGAAFV